LQLSPLISGVYHRKRIISLRVDCLIALHPTLMSSDAKEAASHRSGKLRYKKSREEKRRDYRSAEEEDARRHRKRRRGRDDSLEGTAGPSRHPNAIFGDDLLKAERYEAKMKQEQEWSAKLGDLLQDDFGIDGNSTSAWEEEIARLQGTQFDGQSQQEIPKRWKDAAKGFESNIGRGAAGLKELDEEEYAEYIREGMYRRKHAKDIAFEEERLKRWEEAQARKEKAREEKRAVKRREQEEKDTEDADRALTKTRATWEDSWLKVITQNDITSRDLPWPIHPGPEITKDSVQHFLFHDSEKQEASKRLRKALLRYHPDRFFSSRHYTNITNGKDRADTTTAVEKIAKILSDLVNDRRA
jgi:hypothetical protein